MSGPNALGTNHVVLNGLVNRRQRKPRHRRDLRRRVSVILGYSWHEYYSTLKRMNFPLSPKTRHLESILVYLVYLNKVAPETGSLKTEDFPDQKRAPSTPNSSIYN